MLIAKGGSSALAIEIAGIVGSIAAGITIGALLAGSGLTGGAAVMLVLALSALSGPIVGETAEGLIEDLFDLFSRQPSDPFVFDLDGDGVELTSLDGSGAFFDLDGDGFAERTGWVSSDDGLLALDRGGQAQWGSCIDPLGALNALQLSQGTLVVLADLMRGHDWIDSHDADATRGCLIS